LSDLHANFVFGFIVALDELDLLAQNAAGFVDFFNGMETPMADEPPVNGPERPTLTVSCA
jgi:hypothetical protein